MLDGIKNWFLPSQDGVITYKSDEKHEATIVGIKKTSFVLWYKDSYVAIKDPTTDKVLYYLNKKSIISHMIGKTIDPDKLTKYTNMISSEKCSQEAALSMDQLSDKCGLVYNQILGDFKPGKTIVQQPQTMETSSAVEARGTPDTTIGPSEEAKKLLAQVALTTRDNTASALEDLKSDKITLQEKYMKAAENYKKASAPLDNIDMLENKVSVLLKKLGMKAESSPLPELQAKINEENEKLAEKKLAEVLKKITQGKDAEMERVEIQLKKDLQKLDEQRNKTLNWMGTPTDDTALIDQNIEAVKLSADEEKEKIQKSKQAEIVAKTREHDGDVENLKKAKAELSLINRAEIQKNAVRQKALMEAAERNLEAIQEVIKDKTAELAKLNAAITNNP